MLYYEISIMKVIRFRCGYCGKESVSKEKLPTGCPKCKYKWAKKKPEIIRESEI
jgi:predicted Zn-ribbon and HTH transcriptional regulator